MYGFIHGQQNAIKYIIQCEAGGIYPRITLSITVERLNLHKLFVVPTIFINGAVQIAAKCYNSNVR